MQTAASTLGFEIKLVNATAERDLDAVFASLPQLRADALVVSNSSPFNSSSERLGALAARHAVPTIFQSLEFVAGGGLLSYGGRIEEAWRLAGLYVGRILKGEKPTDLPVQQATKVEMILNLKAARALDINVPLPLLGRADEVIE